MVEKIETLVWIPSVTCDTMGALFTKKTYYIISKKDEILAVFRSQAEAEVCFRAITQKNFTLYKVTTHKSLVTDQTLLYHTYPARV